jgi:hypothetical protein
MTETMTAQIPETLIYNDEEHSMCDEPLEMYSALGGEIAEFEFTCTALWRGYVGTWEIIDGRLYMTGLRGTLKNGTEANLASVFPNYPDRVFAHWFTGKVRLPQGKQLEYVHMGYGSVYERDLFLHLENGVIIKTEVIENGESENPNAPEGYGVGGWTTFPSKATQSEGDQT